MPKDEVIRKIKDLRPEDVIPGMVEKYVDMQGFTSYALFNCETGEMEFFGVLGNTWIPEDAHLILLDSMDSSSIDALEVEDMLDQEEIEAEWKKVKEEENPDLWEIIRNIPDYWDRVAEAMIFYADQANRDYWRQLEIEKQLDEIYGDSGE